MKEKDSITRDMFEVPIARSPMPGALDVSVALRHIISELLKSSPLSRNQVASRMSELLGHEVSKHQLDSWTAESREGWRFPLEYLPAFEVAIESHEVMAWLANIRGARLSIGREALQTQLGKLEVMKADLLKQEKALKRLIGESND